MTNTSKHKLQATKQKELFVQFANLFANVNQNESSVLFETLFTDAEKVMFIKRLAIILMLSKNHSTYAIAKTLYVSDSTVREIKKKYVLGMFSSIVDATKNKSFDAVKFWATVDILVRAGMPSQGKDRWKKVLGNEKK